MPFCGSGQPHHALGPNSIIIRKSQLTTLELRGPHVNQGNPGRDELQPENTTEGFVSKLPMEKTHWGVSSISVGVVSVESFYRR